MFMGQIKLTNSKEDVMWVDLVIQQWRKTPKGRIKSTKQEIKCSMDGFRCSLMEKNAQGQSKMPREV
jgi:hypothetical protein